MKILAVNWEYTTTGSTLALLGLAEHLQRAGHEVVATAVVPKDGPVKQAYRDSGIATLDEPSADGIDVAICNTVLTAPLLLQFAETTKTIWWLHEGSVGLTHLLNHPSSIAAFYRASAVVFPIAHLRDAVYRSFLYDQDQSRFAIIPYGIPSPGTPPARPPDNIFRVVSVGSVYPRKRHEDLIRAMTLLDHPTAKCTIIGQFFSLPDDCISLIAGNPDRYELLGELGRDEAMAQLAAADVFSLPSGSEVLPLTSLEAGLLGKAIILSDLAVYEGIWRHGHNCLTHPVGATGMLAQSIAMLAGNPDLRARLGGAARQMASRYTEAAFNARFDALLNTL